MLYDVSIIRFTRGLTGFDMIITAESAFQSAPSKWTFKKGIERKFDNGGAITESSFKEREYGFQLEARELKRAQKVPQEMNYYEISRYIERIKTAGYNDLRYTVEKYVKITFPLISVVMAFISIPFGLGIGSRASGAMAGVAVTALIGFVFWFLFSMSVSMGNSGKLPPLVSAGGAHLVFLFGAAYVMLSNRFERG
jgi:lipopolysaccharide export system permease protein